MFGQIAVTISAKLFQRSIVGFARLPRSRGELSRDNRLKSGR
ncbi:hypothetical protein C7S15_8307 [Burkholderia cepacia]|nr:hypothetical protein [Burkholderia cepacia]